MAAQGAQNSSNESVLSAGHRRLYELIDSALLEFGSLEPRQKAIMALAKELQVSKEQLRELVNKARANHPQINAVARVHKLIEDAKASGKTPDLSMFRRLQPAAKSAGKDDMWLGQQLGYMPKFLKEAAEEAEGKKHKKSKMSLVLLSILVVLGVGGFVWWQTYGQLIFEQRQQQALDQAAWEEATETDAYAAYESYLRNHPEGTYKPDARGRMTELDTAAWEQASAENTRAAYQAYSNQYQLHSAQAAARLDTYLTGDMFRDCIGCPQMMVLPAGEFQMGSMNGDIDELPLHKVEITRPIAVGRYEVTFAEWDLCALKGGCSKDVYDSTFGRDKRPVINVSWQDAQDYVDWLSAESGVKYRLLSESEWEFAARGGSSSAFFWGNNLLADRAVCTGCEADWSTQSTAEVGKYAANAFGLHDMNGNVAEWVADCHHASYTGAPATGLPWMAESGGDCGRAVIRGGSWLSTPAELRSANRAYAQRSYNDNSTGFRVARDLN